MSAPTTTEGIAAVMIDIAREDLARASSLARVSNPDAAIYNLTTAIRQLEAARRMLA